MSWLHPIMNTRCSLLFRGNAVYHLMRRIPKTEFEMALILYFSYLFRMKELGISVDDKKVFFGQLLGMSDHISFTLGKYSIIVSTVCLDLFDVMKQCF